MNSFWPLSRELLVAILSDQITDRFVANLIWERLGYIQIENSAEFLYAGPNTPVYWSEKFPQAPEVIAKRSASVHLTRSIPKEHKQLLKQRLHFSGYLITELFQRRTRRATAVNWLLAWQVQNGEELLEEGPLPHVLIPPIDPVKGHPGDLPVE